MAKKYLLLGMAVLVIISLLSGLFKVYNHRHFKASLGIAGLERTMPIDSKRTIAELKKTMQLDYPSTPPTGYMVATRYVLIDSGPKTEKFYYCGNKLVHTKKPYTLPLNPQTASELEMLFQSLGKTFYGESLHWTEVQKLLPKKGTATVTDFETGLSFRVQRRGGTYHADVQPLTVVDTITMKKIYGGQWSWRRRAVIVEVNGRRIAASMNGMPHGAGAIKGNNFPGHFCIHFVGSKVHKSNVQDLAHQLMIAKAAGKLEEQIWKAEPRELITIFYTALKQHDWDMASHTLSFASPQENDYLQENLGQIEDIKTFTINSNSLETEDFLLAAPITLTWRRAEENSFTTTRLLLLLIREGLNGRWYIKASSAKL